MLFANTFACPSSDVLTGGRMLFANTFAWPSSDVLTNRSSLRAILLGQARS